jgi:hypothetical protein
MYYKSLALLFLLGIGLSSLSQAAGFNSSNDAKVSMQKSYIFEVAQQLIVELDMFYKDNKFNDPANRHASNETVDVFTSALVKDDPFIEAIFYAAGELFLIRMRSTDNVVRELQGLDFTFTFDYEKQTWNFDKENNPDIAFDIDTSKILEEEIPEIMDLISYWCKVPEKMPVSDKVIESEFKYASNWCGSWYTFVWPKYCDTKHSEQHSDNKLCECDIENPDNDLCK